MQEQCIWVEQFQQMHCSCFIKVLVSWKFLFHETSCFMKVVSVLVSWKFPLSFLFHESSCFMKVLVSWNKNFHETRTFMKELSWNKNFHERGCLPCTPLSWNNFHETRAFMKQELWVKRVAACCSVLQRAKFLFHETRTFMKQELSWKRNERGVYGRHCNTLQHAATRCNTHERGIKEECIVDILSMGWLRLAGSFKI